MLKKIARSSSPAKPVALADAALACARGGWVARTDDGTEDTAAKPQHDANMAII